MLQLNISKVSIYQCFICFGTVPDNPIVIKMESKGLQHETK